MKRLILLRRLIDILDNIKKLISKNIIVFTVILLFVIVFVGKLFPVNYPTDIYNIKLLGLKEYAYKWFLPSGRMVGILVLYFFDLIGITVDSYITIMKIVAILISTLCIYLFYNMILKNTNENDYTKRVIILLLSILLFLNHGTYQYFYYPESGIRWLSVFFVILAIKNTIEGKNYIKTFIYLFVALNCYQAIIYFYLPALMLFFSIQGKNKKEIFKQTFKSIIVIFFNLLIGYMFVKIARTYFDVISYQSVEITFDLNKLLRDAIDLLWNTEDSISSRIIVCLYYFVIVITLFIDKKYIKETKVNDLFFAQIFIFLSAYFQILCTVSFLNFYTADRILFAYIVGWILCGFVLILNTNILNNIHYRKLCMVIIIVAMCVIFMDCYDITKNSIISREVSDKIGNIIHERLMEYENNSNIKVRKVEYCFDIFYYCWDKEIQKCTGEATMRVFGSWTTDTVLKYYLGNDLEIEKNNIIHSKIFDEKEWDIYDDDQIISYEDLTQEFGHHHNLFYYK